MPLGPRRVYWFATKPAPPGERDGPGGRKHEVLERFAGWHEAVSAVVSATREEAILRNDIVDRDPRPGWSRGLVTLLGDAALVAGGEHRRRPGSDMTDDGPDSGSSRG